MGEDGNAAERFRLPESLAGSIDPIEANPYPPEHPAHRAWSEATREAQAEIFRINANASMTLTPETADTWAETLVVARFDVWAARGVQFVWTDQGEREYAAWLVGYANAWIESMGRLLASRSVPFPLEVVLAGLRRRLGARVHHWRAEALRRIQQQAHASVAAPELHARPSAALVKRRRDAIKKHRDVHCLDAAGFARSVGVSESVIRAIVREDVPRFKAAAQEKVLKAIHMAREEWYRE